MDLYVHNTCIEFKTNILRGGAADQEYVAQLDGYLKNLLKAGSGVRNGILTTASTTSYAGSARKTYHCRRMKHGASSTALNRHPACVSTYTA